ncbi:MAG TPA: D-threitol dehydrogenase [Stenotrophomonas sp.]|nr:D-threitol dehydrogenase [Stenotrophomonas sp.]
MSTLMRAPSSAGTDWWREGFDFSGRTAVVSGGAAGIGAACARLLAERGAQVAVLDRDPGVAMRARALPGPGHLGVQVDLCQLPALRAAANAALDGLGRIDMLVNSAGVALLGAAAALDEADWDVTLDTNLKASFFLAQAVAPAMRRQGRGRIVNLASQASVVGLPRHAAYCASKAAVVGMTRVLALEWAAAGITVNAVSPTIVETELGKRAWAGSAGARARRDIPLRRFAQPQEVAAAVLYLLSDGAAMVTGENLVIDGGYSIR